jgi:hypothetical protein
MSSQSGRGGIRVNQAIAQIPKTLDPTINPLQKSGQNHPNGSRILKRESPVAVVDFEFTEMRVIGLAGQVISVTRTDALILEDETGGFVYQESNRPLTLWDLPTSKLV